MRRRFIVRGRVQGVNFRANAAERAAGLGLTGRIWNRDDGAVELVAEGEAAALERFAGWLREGPRLAQVTAVEATDLVGDPRYGDFRISWDAAE
ncbi:MAG: acylphosphatase [Candidatus Limnocylindria bacterium]